MRPKRLAMFYICSASALPASIQAAGVPAQNDVSNCASNSSLRRERPEREDLSEAYEAVDTRDLVQPPSGRMVVVHDFLGFLLAVLISYFVMYRQASSNLNNSIDEVLKQDVAAQK